MYGYIALAVILAAICFYVIAGFTKIRQNERATLETLGSYTRCLQPGFHFIWPFFQSIYRINVTERMAIVEPQEIITEDKLNATVDLVVYYKVKKDDQSLFKSLYEVNNFRDQIIVLAQTTARNVIGGMVFSDVNSKRNELNIQLAKILKSETQTWGVEIVRVELKEIVPPKEVQLSMNQVLVAQNQKRAAKDFADAEELKSDGIKRASIKTAEGKKQAAILEAEGQAKAFDLVNESFKGNAQVFRKLEVAENSLKNNSKIILPEGKSLVNVIGSLSDIAK
jgi:regulator of protease activity HflC (stomatin/prohibitin superfamily)